jgi:methylenetetrahydrofolate dehydrogenase (NADP+)/methenyltetrahydrofolate cyclohydrolase
MTARLIDGKEVAQKVRAEWKVRADRLRAQGVVPGLAVIMIGENPASRVYVRNKVAASEKMGTSPSNCSIRRTPRSS